MVQPDAGIAGALMLLNSCLPFGLGFLRGTEQQLEPRGRRRRGPGWRSLPSPRWRCSSERAAVGVVIEIRAQSP